MFFLFFPAKSKAAWFYVTTFSTKSRPKLSCLATNSLTRNWRLLEVPQQHYLDFLRIRNKSESIQPLKVDPLFTEIVTELLQHNPIIPLSFLLSGNISIFILISIYIWVSTALHIILCVEECFLISVLNSQLLVGRQLLSEAVISSNRLFS